MLGIKNNRGPIKGKYAKKLKSEIIKSSNKDNVSNNESH